MRLAIILLLTLILTSCAKNPSEIVDEAIDVALTKLSDGDCDGAIDVLEDAERDTSNAIYLQVLASAYACRAGFDERDFLLNQITKIDSDPTNFMKSLTTLSLSDESEADSEAYLDLRESLEVLLYVDSDQPSQAAREVKYGVRKAGDMGVQALFLSLTQLGKFLHFYGNVDSLGAKGAGAVNTDEQGAIPSTCFVEYTQAQAVLALAAGIGGACNDLAVDDGHPNLLFTPAATLIVTKRRMCEGLTLLTNIIDILDNLTLPADSSMGDLTSVSSTVNDYKATITTADPALATLISTTSQATCETLVETPAEFDRLQFIYALLFEKGLQ